MDNNKHRGRPVGHKLSEETKDKIRNSRLGRAHTEETRNKISKSLVKHFKGKDLLSESMEKEYSRFSEDVCDWICVNEDKLNELEDIVTDKRMLYLNQIEISYGNDIERFCHNATPEFLLMLKEDLIELGFSEEIAELNTLI